MRCLRLKGRCRAAAHSDVFQLTSHRSRAISVVRSLALCLPEASSPARTAWCRYTVCESSTAGQCGANNTSASRYGAAVHPRPLLWGRPSIDATQCVHSMAPAAIYGGGGVSLHRSDDLSSTLRKVYRSYLDACFSASRRRCSAAARAGCVRTSTSPPRTVKNVPWSI